MFGNVYKNKSILVTGHTGFKGSWMSQWLLQMGAEVCGYSIDIPSKPSLFEALKLSKNLEHITADVRDLKKLSSVMGKLKPDYVFHLAAQAYVRKSYDVPVETFDTNVMGTVNVLEAMRKCPSASMAVVVTTDKCYLNLETGRAFKEDDKLGGHDPYSASKAATEIAFQAYQKSFFNSKDSAKIASGRAGNVIGGGDWSDDRLVPDCVREWAEGKTVTLRSPQAVRPWQHVMDSICGYLTLGEALITRKVSSGESFNFGPRESSMKTVLELVTELQKTWPNAKFKVDPSQVGNKKESTHLFLNCEKAEKSLHWIPCYDFSKTVSATADWYKEFYKNKSSAIAMCEKQIRDFEVVATNK